MNKIMDWILSQMRLVDTEDEQEDSEQETVPIEKSWLELVHRKKEKVLEEEGHVYFKNVQTYEDCKLVIDNYKMGAVYIQLRFDYKSRCARHDELHMWWSLCFGGRC